MANPQAAAWMAALDLNRPVPRQSRRKLTPQQISEIQQASSEGATAQELALRYGVAAATIRHYRH